MDSITSNKTLDTDKESIRIRRRKRSVGALTTDGEHEPDNDYQCDDDILYSTNGHVIGHCKPHDHMLSGMVDGVMPGPMDRLHYPIVHPHMAGIPAFSPYRPMVPFKRGKQRFDYGYGHTNFWLPGGRGGGCYRYPSYRLPYFSRGHRSYSLRGHVIYHQKFPIARDSHSTQIPPAKYLL